MEVHHKDQAVSLEDTYGVNQVVLVLICLLVDFLDFLGFLESLGFLGFLEPFGCYSCSPQVETGFRQKSEMRIHPAREVDEEPLAVFLGNQLVVFPGGAVVLKFGESHLEEERGH